MWVLAFPALDQLRQLRSNGARLSAILPGLGSQSFETTVAVTPGPKQQSIQANGDSLGAGDLVVPGGDFSRPPHEFALETEVAAFADVTPLFDIAQRLDLVPLLDSVLPGKRRQGLSAGQYLLLAAINRAVAPSSKLRFADWYRQTILTVERFQLDLRALIYDGTNFFTYINGPGLQPQHSDGFPTPATRPQQAEARRSTASQPGPAGGSG
jgi:hypothetical protein